MQQLVYTITQAANVACMTESQVKKMCQGLICKPSKKQSFKINCSKNKL